MTEERRSRPILRASLILAVGLLSAGLMFASTPAQADTFNFTSDHCTGGCGTPPFGTVTLTQNGSDVVVVVDLNPGYQFIQTGSGDNQAFKFNATGVVLGDITVQQTLAGETLVAATGAFNGDGTGNFVFGINCSTCGTGGSNAFDTNITFRVASATIADLTAGNNLNIIFVADVLAPAAQGGRTGPIDVTGPGGEIPEPATLLLAGSGLVSIGAWSRRRTRRRRTT
jgi:PEP-CTERM motif